MLVFQSRKIVLLKKAWKPRISKLSFVSFQDWAILPLHQLALITNGLIELIELKERAWMIHDTRSEASSEALDFGFRESSSLRHSEQWVLSSRGACSMISLALSTAKPSDPRSEQSEPSRFSMSEKSVNSTGYLSTLYVQLSSCATQCPSQWRVIICYNCDHMGLQQGIKQLCSLQLSHKTQKDQRKHLRWVSRTSRPNDSYCFFLSKTLSKCKRVNASQANHIAISGSLSVCFLAKLSEAPPQSEKSGSSTYRIVTAWWSQTTAESSHSPAFHTSTL